MEYTREIKVVIEKDTNKYTQKFCLTLGEYDEDKTIKEFIERVKDFMEDTLD